MKIKAIEYPKLVQHEITITEVDGLKYYFSEPSFRNYPNQSIEFIFNDTIYQGTFKIGMDDSLVSQYYIESNLDAGIVATDTIKIFETFKVLDDNKAITYQDAIEKMSEFVPGDYSGLDSNLRINNVGSFSLLNSFDKAKLNDCEILVLDVNQKSLDNDHQEILRIKENTKSTIVLSNDDGFIKMTVNFDSQLGVYCDIHQCSFSLDDSIAFEFNTHQYADSKYLSISTRYTGTLGVDETKDYVFMFSVIDINQLITPEDAPTTTLVQIDNLNELSVDYTIISFTESHVRKAGSSLTSDIVAIGVASDLGIPDGTTVESGTTFQEWLNNFYRRAIHPTYYSPTFGITPNNTSVESGTYVNPSIVPTFNQNDAGDISSYLLTLSVNGGTVSELINDISLQTYNQPSIQVGDGNWLYYLATVGYTDGPIKNNNLGDPDPYGKILAGYLSDSLTYTGYRKAFYGADTETVACGNSDDVRSLPLSRNNPANGTTFTISIPANTSRITIAYQTSLGVLSSVKYVELGNAEVADTFSQQTFNVEGANNYSSLSYYIYTYIPAIPFSSAATYNVTI